jgi:ubiquitin-conjugating enzyme E2 G1
MAVRRLMSELKEINKDPNYFFSVLPNEDNFMEWSFIMIGPPDTFYEGGIFEGILNFPKEYPNHPPKLKFITNIYHPNIYQNGNVCISILHEGVDEYEYESVNERWNPSQSVNTILLSILSILGCPNFDSPANIDASLEWKKSKDTYKKKIFKLVYETQK